MSYQAVGATPDATTVASALAQCQRSPISTKDKCAEDVVSLCALGFMMGTPPLDEATATAKCKTLLGGDTSLPTPPSTPPRPPISVSILPKDQAFATCSTGKGQVNLSTCKCPVGFDLIPGTSRCKIPKVGGDGTYPKTPGTKEELATKSNTQTYIFLGIVAALGLGALAYGMSRRKS